MVQCNKLRLANEQLLHEWLSSLPAELASGGSLLEAALSTVPTLQLTLSPDSSTLDGLLLGQKESPAADVVVDLMLDYRLTYDMDAGDATTKLPPWKRDDAEPEAVNTGVMCHRSTCFHDTSFTSIDVVFKNV